MVSPRLTAFTSFLVALLTRGFHLVAMKLTETEFLDTWLIKALSTMETTLDLLMFEDFGLPERNAYLTSTSGTGINT